MTLPLFLQPSHLCTTVSAETLPSPLVSILANANRTNPNLSPLSGDLIASNSIRHEATPLASPPPLPPVSRWMKRARTSEAVNPALEDDNAALNSLRDKHPSLSLSREVGEG